MIACLTADTAARGRDHPRRRHRPAAPGAGGANLVVPLVRLAWARSGDKGDTANIGVIARRPEYLPYIWARADTEACRGVLRHFLRGEVERFTCRASPRSTSCCTTCLAAAAWPACATTRRARAMPSCCWRRRCRPRQA